MSTETIERPAVAGSILPHAAPKTFSAADVAREVKVAKHIKPASDVGCIRHLAKQFPCLKQLRSVFETWNDETAKSLDKFASVARHDQRICIQFLLNVWDSSTHYTYGRFSIHEAHQVLDPLGPDWAVIQAWVNDPFML